MRNLPAARWAALLLLSLLLAACNFPGAATPDAFATSAAATVAAQLTQVGAATTAAPSPTSTATEVPATATPAPTSSPTEPPCTNKVDFVTDVTIPDDTNIAAGATFTKTWRLRNSGTCPWTTGYALVFDSGNNMGGPASQALTGSVAPGATIDISVSLKAPSANGTYRGNWKLRTADGVIFGIGTSGLGPFWVQITVGPTGQVVFDFYAKACDAQWVSGAGTLPCPGDDEDTEGFVLKLPAPKLENGVTEDEPALEMHPQWVNDGVISGRFPAFDVEDGDRFKTIIGCLFGGEACNVKFQLNYRSDGGPLTPLDEWTETYNGNTTNINIDLSSLAGHEVEFSLVVLANGSSSQDWAFWLYPRITR